MLDFRLDYLTFFADLKYCDNFWTCISAFIWHEFHSLDLIRIWIMLVCVVGLFRFEFGLFEFGL
jgi:hypothetical protein